VEAVNTAEGIIHDTESKMEEFKDQLPADEVTFPAFSMSSSTGNPYPFTQPYSWFTWAEHCMYVHEAQLPQRDRAIRYVSKFVLCFTRELERFQTAKVTFKVIQGHWQWY